MSAVARHVPVFGEKLADAGCGGAWIEQAVRAELGVAGRACTECATRLEARDSRPPSAGACSCATGRGNRGGKRRCDGFEGRAGVALQELVSDRVLGLGCSDLLGVDADHGGSRPEELAEAHGELVQASSDDERDICLLDHGHGFELSEAAGNTEVVVRFGEDAACERGGRGERAELVCECAELGRSAGEVCAAASDDDGSRGAAEHFGCGLDTVRGGHSRTGHDGAGQHARGSGVYWSDLVVVCRGVTELGDEGWVVEVDAGRRGWSGDGGRRGGDGRVHEVVWQAEHDWATHSHGICCGPIDGFLDLGNAEGEESHADRCAEHFLVDVPGARPAGGGVAHDDEHWGACLRCFGECGERVRESCTVGGGGDGELAAYPGVGVGGCDCRGLVPHGGVDDACVPEVVDEVGVAVAHEAEALCGVLSERLGGRCCEGLRGRRNWVRERHLRNPSLDRAVNGDRVCLAKPRSSAPFSGALPGEPGWTIRSVADRASGSLQGPRARPGAVGR